MIKDVTTPSHPYRLNVETIVAALPNGMRELWVVIGGKKIMLRSSMDENAVLESRDKLVRFFKEFTHQTISSLDELLGKIRNVL